LGLLKNLESYKIRNNFAEIGEPGVKPRARKWAKTLNIHAAKHGYISPHQPIVEVFESPFSKHLTPRQTLGNLGP